MFDPDKHDWHDRERAETLLKTYLENGYRKHKHGDYELCHATALKVVDWFPKNLRFTRGKWAKKPFVLADWQATDIIIPALAWKTSEGTRRYREIIIWIPRKNGKSELIAGIALYHMLEDDENLGEGYAIATNEDQAKYTWGLSRAMVRSSPYVAARVDVFGKSLFAPESLFGYVYLSGTSRGTHGKSPQFIMGDEVHEWVDGDLYGFLSDGTANRQQPISWRISTFGVPEGYGHNLYHQTKLIADGVLEEPEVLPVIYQAEKDADVSDIEQWKKANPNYPVSPDERYVKNKIREAQRSEANSVRIKRYHLNIWAGEAERWLAVKDWNKCTSTPENKTRWRDLENELAGEECYAAFDVATRKDLYASVLVFPPNDIRTCWTILPRFWMPKGEADYIAVRAKEDRVPYDEWIRQGALVPTEGNAVDQETVKRQLLKDAGKFKILTCGFDPWQAHKLAIELQSEGIEMMEVRQGFATLSNPSKKLEKLVLEHQIEHGNHPVFRWNAANVVVVTDDADNIKPSKKKSRQKIDGIAATVSALALAETWEEPEPAKQSYLASSDIVVI